MTSDLNNFVTADASSKNHATGQTDDEAPWQILRREVKAVSLDLWGTILDDQHPPADTILYSEQRQNFLRDELRRLGHDFLPEQMHAAYKHAWQHLDELWGQQIAFGAKEGLQAMLQYLNVGLPSESFQRTKQFFEEVHRVPPVPMAGALAAVQALAQKYPLALISDTAWTPGRVLREIFAHYEILDCFRLLIYSGEIGITKPHPGIFQMALWGLKVKPQECLHVGDLQRTDIAGAKAVGMHTAWIRRVLYAGKEQQDHGPDVVVDGVMEVAKKLLVAL